MLTETRARNLVCLLSSPSILQLICIYGKYTHKLVTRFGALLIVKISHSGTTRQIAGCSIAVYTVYLFLCISLSVSCRLYFYLVSNCFLQLLQHPISTQKNI